MRRVTPALVVSVLAFVLAAGGTAVAGGYIITKTSQIKPSVKRALAGQRGPQGPQGAQGAQGVAGAQGPPGLAALATVASPPFDLPSGSYYAPQVNCPDGMRVIGTGFLVSVAQAGIVKSYGTFVGGFIFNNSGVTATGTHIQGMCAQLPPTASVSAVRARKAAVERFAADVAQAKLAFAAVRQSR
jgi:hypothetical protein